MNTMKIKTLLGVLMLILAWAVTAGAEEKTADQFD